jgi:uncharacterized protein YcbK (DUF882 family)
MNITPDSNACRRRRFLGAASRLAALVAAPAGLALGAQRAHAALSEGPRRLSLFHTHTNERLTILYAQGGQVLADAQRELNHFLRDHYSGEVGTIDPILFDQLHQIQQALGGPGRTIEVISGYRCADSNQRLREQGGGGVARRSLHMQGRAIDVRLTGVSTATLRDAALGLQAGGVGYYARDRFVHIDTGRVRTW